MENTARKRILVTIDSAIILRNLGLMENCVIRQLARVADITLLVPRSALEVTSGFFNDLQITIVPLDVERKTNGVQTLFNFFADHLIFSDGAKLHAYYGVRINETRLSVSDRIKYVLKLVISNTLGKSRYLRTVFFPWLRLRFFIHKEAALLLEKYKPDIIFLSNVHSAYDLAILSEAKRTGIKTIGMPGSWDHLPKKYVPIRTDMLLVQNGVMEKEAVEYQDYGEDRVRVVGFPYYDIFSMPELLNTREEFFKRCGFDASKKMVVFVSSAIYAPDEGDCVAMILKARADGRIPHDTQLFIRTYPGISALSPTRTMEKEKFSPFEGVPGVYVQWIQQKEGFGDPWLPNREDILYFLNLIHHADIIVNTCSSVALEASALMRPLVNIRFDGYKKRPYATSVRRYEKLGHYKPVYETGGGILAEREEDLIAALALFLKDPHANDVNLKLLKDTLCYKIDGKSSERIAHEIMGQSD